MFVRVLFVFDLLFNLFRTALYPSVEKQLPPWLFIYAAVILSLIVGVHFPFGVSGRMWNSIKSVPGHCLSIYFFDL